MCAQTWLAVVAKRGIRGIRGERARVIMNTDSGGGCSSSGCLAGEWRDWWLLGASTLLLAKKRAPFGL